MIFGRKGCNEERDWAIRIYLATDDDDYVKVGEQLTKKEVEELYKEIKEKISDKNNFIEINTGEEVFLFIKGNIVCIRLYKN